MKYTKAGGTVGLRIIQKGHAPEGFADYDFVVKDNGIGMAITKNIVDMMGGNIKVKSELGKGSEITIGLRFKTTSATKNRGVIQELNGFRALVADDNMDSCVSVENIPVSASVTPQYGR